MDFFFFFKSSYLSQSVASIGKADLFHDYSYFCFDSIFFSSSTIHQQSHRSFTYWNVSQSRNYHDWISQATHQFLLREHITKPGAAKRELDASYAVTRHVKVVELDIILEPVLKSIIFNVICFVAHTQIQCSYKGLVIGWVSFIGWSTSYPILHHFLILLHFTYTDLSEASHFNDRTDYTTFVTYGILKIANLMEISVLSLSLANKTEQDLFVPVYAWII